MHSNIHNPTKLGLPSFNFARIETLSIYLFANLCPFSLCCSRADGDGRCRAAIDVGAWSVKGECQVTWAILHPVYTDYSTSLILFSPPFSVTFLPLLTHLTWINLNSLTSHLSCWVLGTPTFWYTGQWRSKSGWLHGLFVDWRAYILPVADSQLYTQTYIL